MYLNYPNNPTGATADQVFFEKTVAFAKAHDIAVLHDFAYGAIGFHGQKPVSFLEIEGAKEVGIEMYTLSKTYNMAGWRVGFAVGNPSIIETLNLIQDHLYVSLFPAVQKAAMAACQRIGWKVEAPMGSFFAWLPVPSGFTSENFADYLLEKPFI